MKLIPILALASYVESRREVIRWIAETERNIVRARQNLSLKFLGLVP